MTIKSLSKDLYREGEGRLTSRMRLAVDEVKNGDVVLEIGVGAGELTRNISRSVDIKLYAVDVAEGALESVKPFVSDVDLVNISSEALKFCDDFFDVVICLEVFEHLDNPYHALAEIQRVLKPGGKLLISIPNYRGGHIVIYPGLITQKFFRMFLRQNYFEVTGQKFWGPVWNKDNMGILLESKLCCSWLRNAVLRVVQVFVRFLQLITAMLLVKAAPIYWCYFFVCRNRKDLMDKPFWVKQLEQTSELGEGKGWYDRYYHQKV